MSEPGNINDFILGRENNKVTSCPVHPEYMALDRPTTTTVECRCQQVYDNLHK